MRYKSLFIKSLLLLVLLVIAYLLLHQKFNYIDSSFFLFMNKNLLNNRFSQNFWGLLCHKNESWINVIVMIGINILSILVMYRPLDNNQIISPTKRRIFLVLYCWLSFQVFLLINILIFQKILHIHRDSPSILISGAVRLSETLSNLNIKDYSNNSFPAGHALVLIYWALFVNLYATNIIKIISVVVCIFLVLSRMISGAHWLSDTVFSLILGWVYFNLSMWLANSYEQIKNSLY